jgi:Flp pilus assembly protein TadG
MIVLPLRNLLGLARDERGASLVELALLAPFLGTLMLGMVDLGQGLSARHDLQQAVNHAIELALAREAVADDEGIPSYEFLRDAAAEAAGVPLGSVVLTKWRECNGVVQTTYDAVCPPDADGNPQEVARYVRIRIASTYTPSFRYGPIGMSSAANADGTVPMAAEAAVRIQ